MDITNELDYYHPATAWFRDHMRDGYIRLMYDPALHQFSSLYVDGVAMQGRGGAFTVPLCSRCLPAEHRVLKEGDSFEKLAPEGIENWVVACIAKFVAALRYDGVLGEEYDYCLPKIRWAGRRDEEAADS